VDNTPEARSAIEKNGWVSVSFFKEKQNPTYDIYYNNFQDITSNQWNKRDFSKGAFENSYKACSIKSFSENSSKNYISFDNNIETGRIEKGNKSNQTFKLVDMEFDSFPSITYTYQILPTSYIPVDVLKPSQIRSYCTSCGTRTKRGWKFCRECGSKL
jgi:hypothetical protein